MNAVELFIAAYQIVFLALLLLAIGVGAACNVTLHVSHLTPTPHTPPHARHLTHTTSRTHPAARDRGVPLPLTRKMKLVPCIGCGLEGEDSMEHATDEGLLLGRK
jgi:hypothetical protein